MLFLCPRNHQVVYQILKKDAMRTITPKQNEKRIGENAKVRWETAQAWKKARRILRLGKQQKPIFRG